MSPSTILRACFAAYVRMLLALVMLLTRVAAWLDRHRVARTGAFTQLLSGPAAKLLDRIEKSNHQLSRH